MQLTRCHVPSRLYLACVLSAGVIVRLVVLTASSFPAVLERRPELSSPFTSIRSLREGVFLYNNSVNAYAGGVFHHPPVYLLFFSYIVPVSSQALTAVFWTFVDVLGSMLLVQIWRSRTVGQEQERDYLVALLYIFNPYTLLSCLARSTTSLDNLVCLGAIATACHGNGVLSMMCLALGAHTSLYPIILFPSLLLILKSKACTSSIMSIMIYSVVFFASSITLVVLNTHIAGPEWIRQTWGAILTVADLTPNVGMWWYFFTEIFEHFRSFFLGVFQLHTLIYIVPLCIRISDPVQTALVIVGVIATWKSYPTIGDMAIWAGLLGCFPEIISHMRHPLFSLSTHLYTAILLPLLHSLWLLTGTGNSNFFYAATMVYGLNSSLAVADVLGAITANDIQRQADELLFERGRDVVNPNWVDIDLNVVQLASLE